MGSQSHGRAPLSEAELTAVAVGEQPEEDGLLACLKCGHWYRGLGSHVAGAHDLSADEYRARHELPHQRGLWAADARRAAGERAAERQASGRYPKAIKTRLTGDRAQVARSVTARLESYERAGTRSLMRAHWERLGKQKRERVRAKYEDLAKAAGYAGIDDLIEKVKDESATVLAQVLGVSVSGAKWVRRLHAADFNLDHHPLVPASMPQDELDKLAPGEQPLTASHVLCRLCGRWFRTLSRHVSVKHQLSVGGYRRRFAIADDAGLVPADVAQANQLALVERKNRRAREHGYAGYEDLISQTRDWPVRQVAALMGVDPMTIYSWRRRLT